MDVWAHLCFRVFWERAPASVRCRKGVEKTAEVDGCKWVDGTYGEGVSLYLIEGAAWGEWDHASLPL